MSPARRPSRTLALCTALLLALPATAFAMRFSHKTHAEKGADACADCHAPGALSIIPPRTACLGCHAEKDIEETVLGPARTHTPLWVRQHGRESTAPSAQCASCHGAASCADCHRGGEIGDDLKRRTVLGGSVPRTHTSRFGIVHPLKAIGGASEACYTCHSRKSCVDCHEAYRSRFPERDISSHQKSWRLLIARADVPDHNGFSESQCQDCHPGGAVSSDQWSARHAEETRKSLSACQSCHPSGEACMACHSARNGLQVSPHPKNWRSIQRKYRSAAPETCERCHAAGSF